MRIPTYRGQAQITTQAPGQSFTARKNPNPFIKEALAKGNMQAELFSQAASYAATQRKIKVEALKNEAILGAKEAMMELSDAFLNDNQPYDIFEPDGTGRWDKETKDIKNKLRAKIGTDRYALAAFDTAFAQAELPLRFQLKGQIDTKIEKMHVASVNEGWEDFIIKYSDPNVNTTSFDLDFASETEKTKKAVELGGFEKDVMSELPNNVLKRIATDLIPAYAGRNLSKTLNLMENFELLQEIEAGEATIEDLDTNIPPHVLNVLSKVPTADAQKILSTTLTQAMQAMNAQQEIKKTEENKQKFILESVTNRFQYYSSKLGSEQITADQLSETDRLVPGLQKLAETGGVITAAQAQDFIKDFLYERNAVTATIKKVFDDAAEIVTTPYAGESIPGIYDDLFNKLTFGDLSQTELENNKPYLDKEDYGFLANGIDNKRSEQLRQSERIQTSDQTRANAAFTASLNAAKGLYSYDELTADDEELGTLKRAAFFAVTEGLQSFKLKTLVDGSEFSPATINAELQRLVKENEQVFKLEALDNYETFLRSNKVSQFPDLKLTTVDPFKTLDDWYASQDTDLVTPGVQVNKFLELEYGRISERLKEFNKFGIFQ